MIVCPHQCPQFSVAGEDERLKIQSTLDLKEITTPTHLQSQKLSKLFNIFLFF